MRKKLYAGILAGAALSLCCCKMSGTDQESLTGSSAGTQSNMTQSSPAAEAAGLPDSSAEETGQDSSAEEAGTGSSAEKIGQGSSAGETEPGSSDEGWTSGEGSAVSNPSLFRAAEDGSPAEGWFTDEDGTTGYCGEGGFLLTGFHIIDGFRYFFTEEGDRVSGLYSLENGQTLCFTEDGKQLLNSVGAVGRDFCYFDGEGYLVKDQWITFPDGGRGLADAEGRLFTGCHRFGDRVYTFTSVGRYRHDIPADGPMVALTYDDGPSTVNTPVILNTLRTYGAHATFFVLGRQVNSCSAIIQEIEDSSCEIGNHTYNHYILTNMDAAVTNQEISATSSYVQMITGDRPMIMRPPTGGFNDQSCANVAAVDNGYPLILWSLDTIDWKHRDAATTCQRIREQVRDGSIILMHDMEGSSATASAVIIPELIAAGYQLVTVSELAAARWITMEPGHVYNHFYPEEAIVSGQ